MEHFTTSCEMFLYCFQDELQVRNHSWVWRKISAEPAGGHSKRCLHTDRMCHGNKPSSRRLNPGGQELKRCNTYPETWIKKKKCSQTWQNQRDPEGQKNSGFHMESRRERQKYNQNWKMCTKHLKTKAVIQSNQELKTKLSSIQWTYRKKHPVAKLYKKKKKTSF